MKSSLRARLSSVTVLSVLTTVLPAGAQETLPEIEVTAAPSGPAGPATPAGPASATVLQTQTRALDAARAALYPRTGANTYEIDRKAIEALPQGAYTPLDKVLLQTPGVAQDSAEGGNIHIRNEHANVQYRINGILLPDGVAGFGQIIDTSFVGTLALLTGALPAQYGLRTAGVVDITTRDGAYEPGGTVGIYGGSHGLFQTNIDYGANIGKTQVFVAGRLLTSNAGIENPTSSFDALHNITRQGRFFGYASTLIDDATRVSFITGTSINKYQIPNSPGQPPMFTAFGVSDFNSAGLNENQIERSFYNVVAIQRTVGNFDAQLSAYNRYSTVHFVPDPIGDLVFNGVASDVFRSSILTGIQGDAAAHFGLHTLRFGFGVSGEKTRVVNSNTVLPLDDMGNPIDAPFGLTDVNRKLGILGSVYVQDEWKITNQLSLNAGLRFDQMDQYVTANQLSPRVSLTYQPFVGTTFHAGYARYFTPPPQALAAPVNIANYANTTLQPDTMQSDPVRPERSHYFDVGVTQTLLPGLDVGVAAYYKIARNLLDDGQFGAALVQTAFNYDRAYNNGVEFKANYRRDNLSLYANLALARQRATQVSSNQYLFGADELDYINSHYVYTDHAQTITGSAGASYLYEGTRVSADLIYGSGLRSDFANTGHLPFYSQVNVGISHEFPVTGFKGIGPLTMRFDVVNVFDSVYQIRDGSGIGVFAPQYGPRRGFFAGLSQKF